MNNEKLAEQRYLEHSKGWLLAQGDQQMFCLDFAAVEPPCYRFRLTPLNFEAEQIIGDDQAMKLMLHSDSTSYISLQDESITVGTNCFWACKEAATTLLLRDARPF